MSYGKIVEFNFYSCAQVKHNTIVSLMLDTIYGNIVNFKEKKLNNFFFLQNHTIISFYYQPITT